MKEKYTPGRKKDYDVHMKWEKTQLSGQYWDSDERSLKVTCDFFSATRTIMIFWLLFYLLNNEYTISLE